MKICQGYTRGRKRALCLVVALPVLLFALGALAQAARPPKVMEVARGEMDWDRSVQGVLVRDETAVCPQSYGQVEFLVQPGSMISAGTEVAKVYGWAYDPKTDEALQDVRRQIRQYRQNNPKGIVYEQQLAGLQQKIRESAAQLGGEGQSLLQAHERLQSLLREREQALSALCSADSTLQRLYEREQTLLQQQSGGCTLERAPSAGIVSLRCDGVERLLQPTAIDSLRAKDLDMLLSGSRSAGADVALAGQPLYRLVRDANWYCLLAIQPFPGLQPQTAYSLDFEDAGSYEGTLVSQRPLEDGRVLYCLEVRQSAPELIDRRAVQLRAKGSVSGMLVQRSCIFSQKGCLGVYKVDAKANQKNFVPIEVLAQQGERTLIWTPGADTLAVGDTIMQR